MTIFVPPEYEKKILERVARGEYESPGHVILAGLLLIDSCERERDVAKAKGPPPPIDLKKIIRTRRKKQPSFAERRPLAFALDRIQECLRALKGDRGR